MTREITLTQGKVALVDDDDYESLSRHKWFAHRGACTWYAIRKPTRREAGCRMSTGYSDRRPAIRMHRVVMDAPGNLMVDHINHNGLDNRRCNLRLADDFQNQYNRRVSVANKTGYKGVSYIKADRKWSATIRCMGNRNYLGRFDSPEAANAAYVQASKRLHGEFSYTDGRKL